MARRPRRPTAERLRRRALAHLERHPTSRAHLERLMLRRALPEAALFDVDPEEVRGLVRALLDDLERLRLLDDDRFAEGRARRAIARGTAPRRVTAALAAKGVDADTVARALGAVGEEIGDPAWQAALGYARRRRLGPWRGPASPGEDTAETRRRELAVMARAGFDYATARRLVSLEAGDEVPDAF
ncbi:MAG: RecX family transcriptional regulator [Geminicoccaceae bacterium]|nr:RecX family transcriptional regulator [Geminicoccaceae bacterium]